MYDPNWIKGSTQAFPKPKPEEFVKHEIPVYTFEIDGWL